MIFTRILSVILSASLTAAVIPHNFSARGEYSVPDITDATVQADTFAEAAAKIKAALLSRTAKVSVSIPYNSTANPSCNDYILLSAALLDTDNSSEGDYLRGCIDNVSITGNATSDPTLFNYTFDYYTTADEEKKVNSECQKILTSLGTSKMNTYNKIKAIYRYVADNVTYTESTSDKYYSSAYGALFKHAANSKGISQLVYKLMKDAGLHCRIAQGSLNNKEYRWNIVSIAPMFYMLDASADAQLGKGSSEFFLKGKNDINSGGNRYFFYYASDSYEGDIPNHSKPSTPIYETDYDPSVNVLGDVNGNGTIDAVDASAVLTYYAVTSVGNKGSLTKVQQTAADVNKNKVIDAVDASVILGYYAYTSVGSSYTVTGYIKNVIK